MPAKKKSTAMRGMRLDDVMYKAIVEAAKTRQYASPSAYMRAAIGKELRGSDSALNESEQRISASLERNSKEIQRVSTAQQALFAYVDALAKVILSSLPETDEEGRKSAVARGKLRYPRPEECWSQYGRQCRRGAFRVGEPRKSDEDDPKFRLRPRKPPIHRQPKPILDEFPAGYSSAGCSSAEPACASPDSNIMLDYTQAHAGKQSHRTAK